MKITISPRIFYYAWCFFTTKKTYFAIPGSSANFVITDIIFHVFPSSFLYSMEKMLLSYFSIHFIIFMIFLIQLVFSEPNLHAQIFIFTGPERIHGIMGPL